MFEESGRSVLADPSLWFVRLSFLPNPPSCPFTEADLLTRLLHHLAQITFTAYPHYTLCCSSCNPSRNTLVNPPSTRPKLLLEEPNKDLLLKLEVWRMEEFTHFYSEQPSEFEITDFRDVLSDEHVEKLARLNKERRGEWESVLAEDWDMGLDDE